MEGIMKKIEDIEKMGPDELEAAAMAEDVDVPQGLAARIHERILATELAKEPPLTRQSFQKRRVWQYGSIAAAVVIFAIVLFGPEVHNDTLQDTFEDPYTAYAQVEKVFAEISGKMAMGAEVVARTKHLAEKPKEILDDVIDSKN